MDNPFEEISRIFRADSRNAQTARSAENFLRDLSSDELDSLVRSLSASTNVKLQAFAAVSLTSSGRGRAALPLLASLVEKGHDLSRVGYSLAHAEDPEVIIRMYVDLSRYLLLRLDTYQGELREHVGRFLCDGGMTPAIEPFSRTAVEERLKALEAMLGRH